MIDLNKILNSHFVELIPLKELARQNGYCFDTYKNKLLANGYTPLKNEEIKILKLQKLLTPEVIENLYISEKLTTNEIITKYDCSEKQFYEILKRYKISPRKNPHPKKRKAATQITFTIEEVITLNRNCKSLTEIAKLLKCSKSILKQFLEANNVTLLSKLSDYITDDQLINDAKELTSKELAKKYNLKIDYVRSRLKKYKVKAFRPVLLDTPKMEGDVDNEWVD